MKLEVVHQDDPSISCTAVLQKTQMLCMYIFLVASHFLTFLVSSNDGGKIKTTSCSLCYSHIHTLFEQKLQEWLSNKVHGILNVHSKESCRHNKMCFKCNNGEAAFCCLEKKGRNIKNPPRFCTNFGLFDNRSNLASSEHVTRSGS